MAVLREAVASFTGAEVIASDVSASADGTYRVDVSLEDEGFIKTYHCGISAYDFLNAIGGTGIDAVCSFLFFAGGQEEYYATVFPGEAVGLMGSTSGKDYGRKTREEYSEARRGAAITPQPVSQPYIAASAATPTSTPQTAVPVAVPTAAPTQQEGGYDVWLSATGERYHAINNCRNMNPDKATLVTLERAKSEGYEPCGICKPRR